MTAPPGKPRLHRPLMQGITLALTEILFENRHAPQVVAHALKSNPRWGSRDRALVAESIYDIVRWWRRLDPSMDKENFPMIVGMNEILKGYPLPDWPEFAALDPDQVKTNLLALKSRPAVWHSIPDWLYEWGTKELGAAWEQELEAMNLPAPVTVRLNRLKGDLAALRKKLAEEQVESEPLTGYHDALTLPRRGNLTATQAFKEGWFELQDAGSQKIAPFLGAEPGSKVIDACAGAGGKTLHLAALMQNRGELIACDTLSSRLNELQSRAQRAGVKILSTFSIAEYEELPKQAQDADYLLLDVPCSGSGVIRRNPDAKWKLNPAFIEKTQEAQQFILQHYSAVLKPGGKMVYATCSLFPSENEMQVRSFLASNPGFELLQEENLSPARNGTDGFYMALLSRKAGSE